MLEVIKIQRSKNKSRPNEGGSSIQLIPNLSGDFFQ